MNLSVARIYSLSRSGQYPFCVWILPERTAYYVRLCYAPEQKLKFVLKYVLPHYDRVEAVNGPGGNFMMPIPRNHRSAAMGKIKSSIQG